MKATYVRSLWNEFRSGPNTPQERVHAWSDPASLIVNNADDPTTMFNTAGMQPLVPYLMGKEHPTGSKRVFNIQGCVRTVDIDEVGDASHLTYFEMMGNWSLGDYFKQESVAWSWEFLTQWLKLDPKKLSVTVFEGDDDAPRDEETATLRRQQGVPDHKIAYLGKKDNRRGPAGATGPCGPDTEIFYRVGAEEFPPDTSNVETDEDNWMEIWNNVFMAYYKDEQGGFSELTAKNVDTGMGFERICMVVQHAAGMIDTPLKDASVYDTDIFAPIVDAIINEKGGNTINNIPLGDLQADKKTPISTVRIIADHSRTAMNLIQSGLIPSNEGRGYVLRRIIRRMYFQWSYHLGDLQRFERVLYHIKEYLNILYEGEFTNDTVTIMIDECKQFTKTLHKGKSLLDIEIASYSVERVNNGISWVFSGEKAYHWYETYGFPVELTQEIVQQAGGSIDHSGFEQAMHEAQERSRAGAQQKFAKGTDRATVIEGLPQTEFTGYDELETEHVRLLKDSMIGEQRVLITDRTPFYGEGGGQKGDTGSIEMDDGNTLRVVDVIKYGGVFIHMVEE